MAITRDDVLGVVGTMSVMKLNDPVKVFEEKFGVSAAVVIAVGPAAAGGVAAAGEQTEFAVTPKNAGANKVDVIKAVREITGLGLEEAKDPVGGAPKPAKEGVDKKTADGLMKKLAEAGAEAEAK